MPRTSAQNVFLDGANPKRLHAGICLWLAIGFLFLARILSAQEVMTPENLKPPSAKHPLDVRDLWDLTRVSDAQPSPDGHWVVYVQRVFDVATNKSRSNLHLVTLDGKQHRILTTANSRDLHPRWSPDSQRIAFLSKRSGSYQIWSIRLDGGEASQVTELPVGIESFQWSPKGDQFSFAALVYPDCETLQCTADRAAELEKDAMQARIYDSLLYRHWDTWADGTRAHIFVMSSAGAAPRDLMQSADMDAPPPPWGGGESYDWAADGSGVVFEGRQRTPQSSWTTDLDLYWASFQGDGKDNDKGFVCITDPNLATDSHPVLSPKGHRVAYFAMKKPGYEADRFRIVIYDINNGTRQILTENWDRSPGEMIWSGSGRNLYVTYRDHGQQRFAVIHASDGNVNPVEFPGSVHGISVVKASSGERLVFTMDSFTQSREVYTSKPDGSDLRRLTDTNAAKFAHIELSQPERLTYTGANGDNVEAWFLPPVGFEKGRRYPLVLLVHGGPQGSWSAGFSYRWNPQLYAAAGFAVLAPDFHGSTGYGQAFTDAIRKDWGGKPYEDLMKGVDYVLAEKPWIDSERLGAAGASYGGYMVNWIAGQTHRFKCLVNHDGIFDLSSFYGATEEHWFPEWEFGGPPWESRDLYRTWSPSHYVDSWQTPMLVIQGGRDYRVPEGESFATFNTLQRKGIASKFLFFPKENHWVLHAQNAILWQDTILSWLQEYLSTPSLSGGSE